VRLRQATEEKRVSSSSQRRRKKKGLLGETEKKHTIASTNTTLPKSPSTTKPISGVDFECENTCSFALKMLFRVVLSSSVEGRCSLEVWVVSFSANVLQPFGCKLMAYRQIARMNT